MSLSTHMRRFFSQGGAWALGSAGAMALLGATWWETRRGFAVLKFLTAEGSPGWGAVADPGFREVYEFGSLYLSIACFALAGLLIPTFVAAWLRRPEDEPGDDSIRPFAEPFLIGLLGLLLPPLHFAGFRAPFLSAGFDDYDAIWQIFHVGIFAAIAGVLVARIARRLDDSPLRPTPEAERRWSPMCWAALAFAALYSGVFLWMTLQRHWAFHTAVHDLGLYDQMVWNLLHGGGFRVTTWMFPQPGGGTVNELEAFGYTFVAEHYMPILYLLAPLYAIFPGAETLLTVQCLAVGGAGFAIFLFVRALLRLEALALVLMLAFLLHPSVHEANLKDFHADALEPLFLFLGLLAWQRRSLPLFTVCATLFLMCKEDAALMLAMFGVFLLLRRDWHFGGVALLLGFAYFVIVTKLIVAAARGGEPLRHLWRYQHLAYPIFSDEDLIAGRVPEGVGELMRGFFTNPWAAFNPQVRTGELGWHYAPILTHERVRSLLLLGVPVGFVFLLAPRTWAMLLVPVATAMLSNWDHNFRLRMHYGLAGVMFAFAAAAFAFDLLVGERARRRRDEERENLPAAALARNSLRPRYAGWTVYVLVAGLLLGYYYGRMPIMREFDPATYRGGPAAELAPGAIAEIPAESSVAATNNLGPHLTGRRTLMLFPEIDYLDLGSGERRPVDWIVVDTLAHPWPLATDSYRSSVTNILSGGEYGVVPPGYRQGLLILRRGADTSLNREAMVQMEFALF